MPARIRIYGQEATFQQGCWDCPDDSLQAMLQSMADPRALSQQAEDEHALYCAGRLGGHILTATGWLAAPHPEAEIRLEDLMPAPRQKSQRAGLFGFLKRHA